MAAAKAILAGSLRDDAKALPEPLRRVLSPTLEKRGPAEGHRASAPAHAAARGGLAPPRAREGRRPGRKRHLAFSASAAMHRLASHGRKPQGFSATASTELGIPRKR